MFLDAVKIPPNPSRKPATQKATLFAYAGLLRVPVERWTVPQSTLFPQSQHGFSGCGSVEHSTANSACLRISFEDEVAGGQLFTREFGVDLLFRLNPEQAAGGWFIEVFPKNPSADSSLEYVWVVTPPYHFGNQRYLDNSYGIPTQEAVKNSPREFNFVRDEKQYKETARLVDLALSSRPVDDKNLKRNWKKRVRKLWPR